MDRYRKQILFDPVGPEGQAHLMQSQVVLIGCGALGTQLAENLVRSGVGSLKIVDRDFVDLSNLQRQTLFDEQDCADRLPKSIAAKTKLNQINQGVQIDAVIDDVTSANILGLVAGADVIVDGTDNFETRFLINDAALETGIPWVHAGVLGATGQTMTVIPGQTPCLRCVVPEADGSTTGQTCDTAGVILPAVQMATALQSADLLKILTGQKHLVAKSLRVFNVWDGTLKTVDLSSLNLSDCPACTGHERLWLEGHRGTQSTVLCGRNSVQISSALSETLDLDQLESQLSQSGQVLKNPFLLRYTPADSGLELTLFKNGRAIVSGTEDAAIARTLYARVLG